MAKRFYVSPIVGDGLTPETAYRAKLSQYGLAFSAIIPTNSSGVPLFNWCLCIVNGLDHSALVADSQLDAFPEITLDSTLSVLTNQERNRLLGFLSKRGIPTAGINGNTTFREVLELLGKFLDISFTTTKFDVQ
jgi:hypothetical protein